MMLAQMRIFTRKGVQVPFLFYGRNIIFFHKCLIRWKKGGIICEVIYYLSRNGFMPKKKKKQKWIRFLHRIVWSLAFLVLYPYTRIKYRVKIKRFKEKQKRQYLVLFNHQTALDQFIVGAGFKGPVYYVASEDLFSNGWVSRLLEWAIAPIPIKKQATDARAVLNCMRVMKEGGTIALSPEGNRTYSGKTEYIKPAIVGLVKTLKMPLVLYRIEGGYGVHPRWSDVIRRGKIRAYVSKVVEPEEYAQMSDDELYTLIVEGLYVNEGCVDTPYKKKRLAEYLERAYYVCPDCGLTEFVSNKDLVTCKKCGKTARYLRDKSMEGVDCEWPFRFTTEWYDYQSKFINGLDLTKCTEQPLYTDKVLFSAVELYDKKYPISDDATVCLYGDRIMVTAGNETYDFPFEKVSTVSVLGKNKVNIYFDGKLYQMKGDKRFNGVKYVHFCYRMKNILKGENDEFLGL